MQKRRDADGMERTIPCPHKVSGPTEIGLDGETLPDIIYRLLLLSPRAAARCSVTMLPCGSIFIHTDLACMFVPSVGRHLWRALN